MKKQNSILIPHSATATSTIPHPAVATAHLINQSPSAELVGGVTLYFEPTGTPVIELIPMPNVDMRYGNAVAQGIQNSLEKNLDGNITGLRIWWCDWLWHPVDSSPRAFKHTAEVATNQLIPWLTSTEFIPNSETAAHQYFPQNIFEQSPIPLAKETPLRAPDVARWTIKAPLISHITRNQKSYVSSPGQSLRHRFIGSENFTQTTVSFKTIASTQRPCPIDKLPDFHPEHNRLFTLFADNIRRQLPTAKGFDIEVRQLQYQADGSQMFSPTSKSRCLAALNAALQQAINVRWHQL